MGLLLHYPTPQDGKSLYEEALENGFVGSFSEFLQTMKIKGDVGKSAYEVALDNGYIGSQTQWLESLKVKGDPGKSLYQLAQENGYVGSNDQFLKDHLGQKQTVAISATGGTVTNAFYYRYGDIMHVHFMLNVSIVTLPGVLTFPSGVFQPTRDFLTACVATVGATTQFMVFQKLLNSNTVNFFPGQTAGFSGMMNVFLTFAKI